MSCCAVHATRALAATNRLLDIAGLPIRKEEGPEDPTDPVGFDNIVAQFSADIAAATEEQETKAFLKVLAALDIDWTTATAAERDAAIAAAVAKIPDAAAYKAAVDALVRAELPNLINGTRASFAVRMGIELGDLALRGNAAADYLRNSPSLAVTDYMRRRRESISAKVRAIVARGLEDGARRDDIVAEMEEEIGPAAVLGRAAHYWDVVAGQFAAQARSYGLLTSMQDAGITRYIFEAVLDEVTSDICRYLHGTVYEVAGGLAVFDRLAANPGSASQITPWLRVGRGAAGGKVLYTKDGFGGRTEIAEITRSGVGNRDDKGEFRSPYSPAQLQSLGIAFPPLHSQCRSTIVADV